MTVMVTLDVSVPSPRSIEKVRFGRLMGRWKCRHSRCPSSHSRLALSKPPSIYCTPACSLQARLFFGDEAVGSNEKGQEENYR